MPELEVETIIAPNPGPMTLEGTNTYLVGRDPVTVIDPGPEVPEHIEAVRAAAEERGGIGAVLVTHSHSDHDGGVELLGIEPVHPKDGEAVAGLMLLALETPGHTEDHLCFQAGPVLFCGDLVLGEGSTIVPPADQGGSLAKYMDSLRRIQELDLELMYPGHGPPITDPDAKIAQYIAHREDRQRRLEAALERGERSRMAILREVWDDVPEELLPAAAFAMQAHVEQLQETGVVAEGDLTE
jgi:glyoxylase-like metal-dependent hydrolase (beta-lactamase superfamily II)